jgi:hypothetical protein
LRKEITRLKNYSHGKTNSAEYQTWCKIKERCYNSNTRNYLDYGGRGIVMCEQWKNSFESFYLAMGDRPSKAHSIDRKNVDGNYEPGNCRWATDIEQARNKRNTVLIKYLGGSIALQEFCDLCFIGYDIAYRRLRLWGWSVDQLLEWHQDNMFRNAISVPMKNDTN